MNTRILALAVLFGMGCGSSSSNGQYSIELAYDNLSFTRPVDLQNAGDGTDRLFVVEQAGIIRVFPNDPDVSSSKVFLDIETKVDDGGNEEGLLGLAFHPEYETNRYFYVDYTANNPNRTVIARYRASATDPDVADPNSEEVLMTISQPFGNHNGGQIAFGPDGMLYIAMGDGGDANDPLGHGQNRATLLGAILRIDVDNVTGNLPYAIPADNPFVNNQNGYREEIFAYGLRNPWRFSFDAQNGTLWTGDVGQNRFEEINIVESGKNYGWNVMEGFECLSGSCNTNGLELPVHVYAHESGNISVTGGYVYRGSQLSGAVGSYIYADYGSGRIWSLTEQGGAYTNQLLVDAPVRVASFGVDESNELFVCAFDGRIYRLTVTGTSTENPTGSVGARLIDAYPNPFVESATIAFAIATPGPVNVAVYDVLGRRVAELVNGYLARGDHSVTWDGTSDTAPLSPGVYYLTVRHGETTTTQPLIYQPSD